MAPPVQITTKSGLQYVDIVTGKGPNPQTGYQVCSLPTSHLVWRSRIRCVQRVLVDSKQRQRTFLCFVRRYGVNNVER